MSPLEHGWTGKGHQRRRTSVAREKTSIRSPNMTVYGARETVDLRRVGRRREQPFLASRGVGQKKKAYGVSDREVRA